MLRIASAKNIFIFSFVYTSIVSILFQFVVLPIFLPEIHEGGGLFKGFDMNTYHYQASKMAYLIDEGGLSNLKINGSGSIAGFAAFFYYITGVHEIYILIPFNALLHSLSAVLIYYLINLVICDKVSAFFGATIFIILPTSMFWYTQIHKDGLFILGIFLFIYGFIGILKYSFNGKIIPTLAILMFPLFGNTLSVLMRPYYATVSEIITIVFTLIFSIYIFFKIDENRKKILLILGFIFVTLSILICNIFISNQHSIVNIVNPTNLKFNKVSPSIEVISEQIESPIEVISEQIESQILNVNHSENFINHFKLELEHLAQNATKILDPFVSGLTTRRIKYIRKHGDASENFSNIDNDIKLVSFSDILLYAPRAVQIGLTAPFPNKWFSPGSSQATSMFKLINAFEMMLYYLSFIGVIIIIMKNEMVFIHRIIITYAFINIIAFTIAIPNIGTLHRIRYGFVMLIVCLGCAQLYKLLIKNKRDVY